MSTIYERLEHELKISDLVNPESLGNLMEQFSRCHRVGLVVTDLDGAVLRDVVDRQRFCDAPRVGGLGEQGEQQLQSGLCRACSYDLPRFEQSEAKVARLSCVSEVNYLRARIDNQFEPVGYVIMGPYLLPPKDQGELTPRSLERKLPEGGPVQVAVLSKDDAEEVVRLLSTVVEELVFANYQSYLFEKMHLQLNAEKKLGPSSSSEPSPDDANADGSILESGELRSLF